MSEATYIHKVLPGRAGGPLLFVFHGTGADENQFIGLGPRLLPGATVVAPRGDVSEHGAARYFRRTGEGVYDMADLDRATAKMAGFVREQVAAAAPSAVLGLGYSNGANILASVVFSAPSLFHGAVLMHPLIPFEPRIEETVATQVLMTAGRRDPICPPPLTERLEARLSASGAHVELMWHDGGHEVRDAELMAAQRFLSAWRTEE